MMESCPCLPCLASSEEPVPSCRKVGTGTPRRWKVLVLRTPLCCTKSVQHGDSVLRDLCNPEKERQRLPPGEAGQEGAKGLLLAGDGDGLLLRVHPLLRLAQLDGHHPRSPPQPPPHLRATLLNTAHLLNLERTSDSIRGSLSSRRFRLSGSGSSFSPPFVRKDRLFIKVETFSLTAAVRRRRCPDQLELDVVAVHKVNVGLVDSWHPDQDKQCLVIVESDSDLVIMIFGLSLLLLLELVSSCFNVVPMFVLVGVRLAARFDEIPGKGF